MTKGKGILVSGGVSNEADLRAPRDIANLCVAIQCLTSPLHRSHIVTERRITALGVSQDVAHDASTKVAQSLVLRVRKSLASGSSKKRSASNPLH